MNAQENSKYYVIEVLEPKHPYAESYICVPNSWVRLCAGKNNVALVKLQIEELSDLKKRVKRGEFSEDWRIFLANVKYATNSYRDAHDYIKILNKLSNQEQNHMEIVNEDTASTSNKNVIEPTGSEADKSILSTHVDDSKPVSNTPEQLESTDVQTDQGRTTASKNCFNTLCSLTKTVKQYFQKFKSCFDETITPKHNQKTLVMKKKPINRNQLITLMKTSFGNNYEELKQLHSEYKQVHKMLQKTCLVFEIDCKGLERMLELIDKIENNSVESNVNAQVEEILQSVTNVVTNKSNAGSDKVMESDINITKHQEEQKQNENNKKNPLNAIRGKACKFTLPPEFDPEDSRWTLKHRKKKQGLVELMPYSDVYVEDIKLKYSKMMSKDGKKLARMLLVEIFNESALRVCTLSGKKSNAFDREGSNVRPGLDKHATDVLLNFIEECTLEKKWAKESSLTISNSIRNKIQDIRYKHISNTSE